MKKKLFLASNLPQTVSKLEGFLVGGGSRLLFIPTAATGEGWVPERSAHVEPFEHMGYEVITHDLSKGGDPLPKGFDSLSDFSAVYVCGGNTFFLLKHMRRTGFYEMVRAAVFRGLTYIGSSAGSVAASPDIGYAASLDDPSMGDGNPLGLGFVGFSIFPHLDHPEWGNKVLEAAARLAEPETYLLLRDDQILVIEGNSIRTL